MFIVIIDLVLFTYEQTLVNGGRGECSYIVPVSAAHFQGAVSFLCRAVEVSVTDDVFEGEGFRKGT